MVGYKILITLCMTAIVSLVNICVCVAGEDYFESGRTPWVFMTMLYTLILSAAFCFSFLWRE